jgi:DNA topoisomerase-1
MGWQLQHVVPMARSNTVGNGSVAALTADPYESAKIAGLRYVLAEGPGIVRKKSGKGFTFIGVDGKPVRDPQELQRFRSLVIPPAWTDVWICPSKNGHIQAVGRDARGRKQYRYHPLYRAVRDATKFVRMASFGETLPTIRKQVEQDLALPGLPRRKVLATVVRLLETTCIRVGNEEYAKENHSFGLTTLRDKHVEIHGHQLRFHFRGKSGQNHDIELTDGKLARIIAKCQCLPGAELFHYVEADGSVSRIGSEDVNDYLREITGQDFTAKDFRTWVGTGQALLHLEAFGPCASESAAKKNVVEAVKAVAARLGNKPSTCRKYYIHPAVFDSYSDGSLFKKIEACTEAGAALRREELCVLKLVRGLKVEKMIAA